MTQTNFNGPALKRAMKEALVETLQEQRELLHDVFAEVLEDFALTEAIRLGQKTKRASRDEVFEILRGKS
jgi:signal transduction histidine kinase